MLDEREFMSKSAANGKGRVRAASVDTATGKQLQTRRDELLLKESKLDKSISKTRQQLEALEKEFAETVDELRQVRVEAANFVKANQAILMSEDRTLDHLLGLAGVSGDDAAASPTG